MTKVLVVATSPKTHGGIATVVKAHQQGRQWKQYHCRWVSAHRDGPKWRKLAYMIGGLLKYAALLPFYDIVHIHMSAGTSAKRKIHFVRLARLLRRPVVVHMHCGTQIEDSWSPQMNYIFSKADIGLMLAERIKESVARHTGRSDNLEVCYNPCPLLKPTDGIHRKKYILYSGTIGKNKGYHVLIESFAKIADRFPEWHIMMAGVGEIDKAYALIKSHKLESRVHLLGWVDGEKKDLLFREASIFCLPSFLEGFPMAVLEAWAYGVPVISTPVGGIPDVALPGENILLFSPGNSEELSERLVELIGSSALRAKLSASSVGLASGKFNLDTINEQIGRIYHRLSHHSATD